MLSISNLLNIYENNENNENIGLRVILLQKIK